VSTTFAEQLAACDLGARSTLEQALSRPAGALSVADLGALLDAPVELLAQRASEVTRQRFGRAVRLFAPLYLSNECLSSCTYCGFATGLQIARRTLSVDEVKREVQVLAARGHRSVLLVAGEHRLAVSAEHLVACVRAARVLVAQVAVETQTWGPEVYAELVQAGCEGVVHYQETYDREVYAKVHVAGWKRNFDRRLLAMDAAGRAGARRLGIGVLLGLATDWKADVLALALHARWLQQQHWRAEVSVALPRMQSSAAGQQPAVVVSDEDFVRALCALRLFLPEAGIVVSTREPAHLRDGLVGICATHLSAGSVTAPGGYAEPSAAGEQFDITDGRSPAAVAQALVGLGYEPVWKDAFPLVASGP
jgi:2-iminoacetate synthase